MERRRHGRAHTCAVGRLVATLAIAACVSAGCSSSHTTATATTSTSAPSTTSTTVDPRADAALNVWTDYVRVSAEWLNPPNAADPRIGTYVTARSVESFRERIAVEQAKNISTRPGPNGPPKHDPKVVSSSPDHALIRDCFVDDTIGFNTKTGQAVDSAAVTLTLEVTLIQENGTWKIDRIDERSRRPGVNPCV